MLGDASPRGAQGMVRLAHACPARSSRRASSVGSSPTKPSALLRRAPALAAPCHLPARHRRAGRRGPMARLGDVDLDKAKSPSTRRRTASREASRFTARRRCSVGAASIARARSSARMRASPTRARGRRRHFGRVTDSRRPSPAACRRAGIDDFRVHDCRHTWATWLYQANRDLAALQALGGWKTVSMVSPLRPYERLRSTPEHRKPALGKIRGQERSEWMKTNAKSTL